jgi:hypothetical protein
MVKFVNACSGLMVKDTPLANSCHVKACLGHLAHSIINDLLVPSGATFGSDFDPSDIKRTPWDSLTFTLDGCHKGTLKYDAIRSELGNGTLKPERLASMSELECVE